QHLLEARNLGGQVFSAGAREVVGAHPSVKRPPAPLSPKEPGLEQTLQGGIKGAFFHAKQIARRLLDALHERVSVERLALQDAQHHHFESARKEVARLVSAYLDSSSRQACLKQG